MPDEHAAAPVLDVLKVEVEHLSGPQPALEHEEEHRPVTERAQRAEQCRDLVAGERPGQALRRADPQDAPHGPRPDREVEEGRVAGRDARRCRVGDLLDGVLSAVDGLSDDQN